MTDWNERANAWADAVLGEDRLQDLLDNLCCDLKPNRNGTVYHGPCPVHGGDGDNCRVKTDGHSMPIHWSCYSRHCERNFKPSLLGLVRGVLSFQNGRPVGLTAAERWLKAFLGRTPARGKQRVVRPRSKDPRPLMSLSRQQVRQQLTIPAPYFVARGFAPEVLDRHDVGHSPKLGKSVVPFYDDAGESCVGYIARSELPPCGSCKKHHLAGQPCWEGQEKWSLPAGFPKGSYLYNLHTVIRSEANCVLLVEGPGDVWRSEEAGYLAIALLGTDVCGKQAKKLAALGKTLFLVFDNDEPGRQGMFRAEDALQSAAAPRGGRLHVPKKDLGDMTKEEAVHFLDGSLPALYRPARG
jgi:hypothetical protein